MIIKEGEGHCPKCRKIVPLRENRTQIRCGRCGTFLDHKPREKAKLAA